MTKHKSGAESEESPVEIPELLSVLPLRNSVLFPGSIIPIDVGRKKSVRLIEEAISKERPVIGILTPRWNQLNRVHSEHSHLPVILLPHLDRPGVIGIGLGSVAQLMTSQSDLRSCGDFYIAIQ